MALRPSRVFSIPFGVSFLDALTDALLEGPLGALIDFAGDPLTLAQATLYVPTRRAGRALAAKLAERLRGRTDGAAAHRASRRDRCAGARLARRSLGRRRAPARDRRDAAPACCSPSLVAGWSRAIDRAALKLEADEAFTVGFGRSRHHVARGDLARLIDTLHLEAVPLDRAHAARRERLPGDVAHFGDLPRHRGRALAPRCSPNAGASIRSIVTAASCAPMPAPGARRVPPSDHRGRLDRLDRGDRRAHREHRPPCRTARSSCPALDRGLDPHSWSLLAGVAPTPSHPQYALRRLLDRIGIGPERRRGDRRAVARRSRPAPGFSPRRCARPRRPTPGGRSPGRPARLAEPGPR